MGLFTCLFCIVFSQTVYAKVVPYSRQNALNIEHKLPFSNRNALGEANGVLENQIARTGAITDSILTNTAITNGNANIGNGNKVNPNISNGNAANANFIFSSNDNRATVLLENVNPSSPNQVNANLANENLAASKFADVKLAAQNLANNIATNKRSRTNPQGNYSNLGYTGLPNSNLISSNIRPDLTNQLYRPNYANPIAKLNRASPLYGSIANNYNAPNTFRPFTNSFNLANSNTGQASFLPNFDNGNIANAHALVTGNLSNTITPGTRFAIGGNPFTVLSGLPGSPQNGLNIVADALEVGGLVSVTGKMPFYGTVALSGSLPADGIGTVNYGCTKQHNVLESR